jgi:hypothetical protein
VAILNLHLFVLALYILICVHHFLLPFYFIFLVSAIHLFVNFTDPSILSNVTPSFSISSYYTVLAQLHFISMSCSRVFTYILLAPAQHRWHLLHFLFILISASIIVPLVFS